MCIGLLLTTYIYMCVVIITCYIYIGSSLPALAIHGDKEDCMFDSDILKIQLQIYDVNITIESTCMYLSRCEWKRSIQWMPEFTFYYVYPSIHVQAYSCSIYLMPFRLICYVDSANKDTAWPKVLYIAYNVLSTGLHQWLLIF